MRRASSATRQRQRQRLGQASLAGLCIGKCYCCAAVVAVVVVVVVVVAARNQIASKCRAPQTRATTVPQWHTGANRQLQSSARVPLSLSLSLELQTLSAHSPATSAALTSGGRAQVAGQVNANDKQSGPIERLCPIGGRLQWAVRVDGPPRAAC